MQALCNLIPGTARWSEPLTLLHRQGSRVPQQLRKSPGVTQMAGGRAGHEPGLAGPLSPAACVQICQHLTLLRSQGEDAAEPELGGAVGDRGRACELGLGARVCTGVRRAGGGVPGCRGRAWRASSWRHRGGERQRAITRSRAPRRRAAGWRGTGLAGQAEGCGARPAGTTDSFSVRRRDPSLFWEDAPGTL